MSNNMAKIAEARKTVEQLKLEVNIDRLKVPGRDGRKAGAQGWVLTWSYWEWGLEPRRRGKIPFRTRLDPGRGPGKGQGLGRGGA